MNNWNKILRVVLLISIYCFGVYIPINISLNTLAQTIELHKEQKVYITHTSKTLNPHTQQLENSFSDFSECAFPSFKLSNDAFCTLSSYPTSLLFRARYKQYKNHLKTILIRQRKSDLMFPFHYFW